MTRQQERGAWWRLCILSASLSVLAGWIALIAPFSRGLALASYDLLYLFRSAGNSALPAEAVILQMDELARARLEQKPDLPWNRSVHTRALRELKARHARLVVFDVLWDQSSANPQEDADLAAAIRDHGNVVLAASAEKADSEGLLATKTLRPIKPLAAVAPWGYINWPKDPGPAGIIRRQLNGPEFTNLAWQAAESFGRAPPDRLRARWLNYYGTNATLPGVSFHRLFDTNAFPPDFFAGKAVFVGRSGKIITSTGPNEDSHPTPYARWSNDRMAGVEIQATAFLNLIHQDWFEETSPLTELILCLALGTLFGCGLGLFRSWTAGALAFGGALTVTAAAMFFAWRTHIWFPWLVVVAVQIPVGLGGSMLTQVWRLAREKEALQRQAALAESAAQLPALLASSTESNASNPAARASRSAALSRATVTADAVESARPPPPIPNHQLLHRVGRGAYGEVWLARDDIGTYHAVKVVYRNSFASAAPFEREFRGIQKFTPISRSHPGLVHILHVGRNKADGHFFYIMEPADDERTGQQIEPSAYSPRTLASTLEQCGRLPLTECVRLGLALAAALEHLHQQQLIHRDIKPANILFVGSQPKFADVGLVTEINSGSREASYVGTEGYLAPEGPGRPSADIFSLGMVLYEASTGQHRRHFPSLPAALLLQEGPGLARFNEILLKAGESRPQARYQNAAELADDLAQLLDQL